LWFFHALDRYEEMSGDRLTLAALLPRLRDIVEHHRRGTRGAFSTSLNCVLRLLF
jgi:glycogen debranching enzyme